MYCSYNRVILHLRKIIKVIFTFLLLFSLAIVFGILLYAIKKFDQVKTNSKRKITNHIVYSDTYCQAVKETAKFCHETRTEWDLEWEKK